MTLSDRQLAAVTRTGQDVCVVAGPGSGKTRVLVERFAWLIRERGVPPLRILAITFTEKAATEIKRRLAAGFAGDAALREQVERAYVSTVHGFCGRLLREYPIQAGLDPGFLILDEAESARLLGEAAHRALEGLYQERRPEMRRLLGALHVSVHEGARQPDIAEALTGIYEELRTAGRTVAELRAATGDPAGGLTLAGFVAELRSLVAAAPPRRTAKQAQCLDALLEWADRASAVAGSPACEAQFQLLDEYPADTPRGPGFGGYAALKNERRKLVESTLAAEYFRPLKDLLLDAVERIDAGYREAKAAAGGLDFSDLEERAIALVQSDPRIHSHVRDGFDHILMDELQDTNPLQWRLVNLLRRPGGFFAVGDVNQSIYGFRYASPDAFEAYRSEVESAGGVIDRLYENYRSRAEILSAAERVLEGAPGLDPRTLEAKRRFHPAGEAPVEVIAGPQLDAEEAARAEARGVARRIAALAGRLLIEDGSGGRRPLRFRDVAILARASNALPPIEDALREAGVPYLAEGGKTFFETREARDLAMLVRAIADPGDDAALAGLLRSPLAGAGDELLLRRALQRPGPGTEESERAARFEALLAQAREQSGDVPPDALIARFLDAFNYEDGLDPRALGAVDKFLDLVRGLHQSHPESLLRLAEDLEWRRSLASEAEAPPDDSSDAVRVMTIHKAKGLEFPVVFLPALHRGSGGNGPVICLAPGGGLGVHWRNPATGGGVKDPAFLEGERRRAAREEAEENRLLFVAMTRAEERLVLSFARPPSPRGPHWKAVAGRLGVTHEADAIPRVEAAAADGQPAPPPPVVVPAPAPVGQFESEVSVTALDVFACCPRRYFLGVYLGLEGKPAETAPESGGGPAGAEFGSMVHDLLAGREVANPLPEALELARRFESSELGRRAARATRIERESGFSIAIEDVIVTGRIDLWFEEGGELVLVDYKTDRVEAGAAARRAEDYAAQVRLYALALARRAGKMPDAAYLCFLRPGEYIRVAVDGGALSQGEDLVRSLKRAQENLDFPVREGTSCAACPYRGGLCPAGRAV